MKITLGYDILTHNGFIPNCLNPKFLETIREACLLYTSDAADE